MAKKISAVWTRITRDFLLKRLFWRKRLCRRDLVDTLHVSTAQASLLLAALQGDYPGQILVQGKCYAPAEDFKLPGGMDGDAFLADLLHARYNGIDPILQAGELPPCMITKKISHRVDTDILRALLEALREKKAMEITYVGMKPGEQAKRRVIDPIHLVYVSDRWHVKAFCYRAGDWHDFVLSRIETIHKLMPAKFSWAATLERQRKVLVDIVCAPHPALTADQQRAVIREFGMRGGVLKLSLYEDELFYFRKQYVAGEGEGPPQKMLVE